jgi:hypothetical protein
VNIYKLINLHHSHIKVNTPLIGSIHLNPSTYVPWLVGCQQSLLVKLDPIVWNRQITKVDEKSR